METVGVGWEWEVKSEGLGGDATVCPLVLCYYL